MSKVTKIDSQSKSEVVIDGIVIRQDAAGRYCLNDFHQAAGGHNKHRPSIWMRNAGVNSIIHQLAVENTSASPVSVRKGRNVGGTYVARELVYSYAMWIGHSYHLKAMRALDRQVMSTGVKEVKVAKPREVKSGRYDLPHGNPPAVIEQQGDELTMSSREIAELTGKRHDNVISDIRAMMESLGYAALTFQGCYRGGNGKQLPLFNLPRREVDILLTGYSVPLRAKVIDRWHELEAEVAKPAFNVPTSFADALRLAGELEEQRVALTHQVGVQAEKIAEDKPKVEFHDAVKASVKCQTMLEVANKYGIGRTKLFNFLRDEEVLRKAECSPPYQRFIDSGHFEVDPKFFKKDGEFVHYTQTMVTGKGEIYIGKLLRKAGLVGTGE